MSAHMSYTPDNVHIYTFMYNCYIYEHKNIQRGYITWRINRFERDKSRANGCRLFV